jgi:hypothetical protein
MRVIAIARINAAAASVQGDVDSQEIAGDMGEECTGRMSKPLGWCG